MAFWMYVIDKKMHLFFNLKIGKVLCLILSKKKIYNLQHWSNLFNLDNFHRAIPCKKSLAVLLFRNIFFDFFKPLQLNLFDLNNIFTLIGNSITTDLLSILKKKLPYEIHLIEIKLPMQSFIMLGTSTFI